MNYWRIKYDCAEAKLAKPMSSALGLKTKTICLGRNKKHMDSAGNDYYRVAILKGEIIESRFYMVVYPNEPIAKHIPSQRYVWIDNDPH